MCTLAIHRALKAERSAVAAFSCGDNQKISPCHHSQRVVTADSQQMWHKSNKLSQAAGLCSQQNCAARIWLHALLGLLQAPGTAACLQRSSSPVYSKRARGCCGRGRELSRSGYDYGEADALLQDAMACFEEAAVIDPSSTKVLVCPPPGPRKQ